MSHVTCRKYNIVYFYFYIYIFFFVKIGGANRWWVCYQRGLPYFIFNNNLYWYLMTVQYSWTDNTEMLKNSDIISIAYSYVHNNLPKLHLQWSVKDLFFPVQCTAYQWNICKLHLQSYEQKQSSPNNKLQSCSSFWQGSQRSSSWNCFLVYDLSIFLQINCWQSS